MGDGVKRKKCGKEQTNEALPHSFHGEGAMDNNHLHSFLVGVTACALLMLPMKNKKGKCKTTKGRRNGEKTQPLLPKDGYGKVKYLKKQGKERANVEHRSLFS